METITPVPDEPAKDMDEEIADVLCRLDKEYSNESVNAAITEMDDPAKFNLVQALHELERNIVQL